MKPPQLPGVKYAAEFLGTLILVFTVACNVHSASFGAAISVGLALTALVYTMGPISGGHLNPAVSFAVYLVGGLSAQDAIWYVVSQVAGGLCAAVLHISLLSRELLLQPAALYTGMQAVVVEVIYSAALCYVFLGSTSSENMHFGLAVGSTVTAASIAAGSISGCCINPALAAGSILVAAVSHGSVALHYHAMYLVAPFCGGILSAILSTLAGTPQKSKAHDDHAEDPLLLERGGYWMNAPSSYRALGTERSALSATYSAPIRVVRHEPFYLPSEFVGNSLMCGCRWYMHKTTVRGTPVKTYDVDLACAVFSDAGECVGGVYFAENVNEELGLAHSGDEVLGGSPRRGRNRDQDSEFIKLRLSSLKDSVSALVFTAMIFSPGLNFGEVEEICVRLVDISDGHREILRYEKKDFVSSANALVAAMIYRDGSSWIFKAIDQSYELPPHSTYRRLIPEMQEQVRNILPVTEVQ